MTKTPAKTTKPRKMGVMVKVVGEHVALDFTDPAMLMTPDEARALATGLRAAADVARRNAVTLDTDDKARRAYALREEGKSLSEVAEALNTNVPTASRWAQRGRGLVEKGGRS